MERGRLALGICVLAAAIAVPATVAQAKHAKPVSVHFRGTLSDRTLLDSARVPVVLRSGQRRKVTVSIAGFSGGPQLAKRGVKLRRGKRRLALPLNPAGRDVLDG